MIKLCLVIHDECFYYLKLFNKIREINLYVVDFYLYKEKTKPKITWPNQKFVGLQIIPMLAYYSIV